MDYYVKVQDVIVRTMRKGEKFLAVRLHCYAPDGTQLAGGGATFYHEWPGNETYKGPLKQEVNDLVGRIEVKGTAWVLPHDPFAPLGFTMVGFDMECYTATTCGLNVIRYNDNPEFVGELLVQSMDGQGKLNRRIMLDNGVEIDSQIRAWMAEWDSIMDRIRKEEK